MNSSDKPMDDCVDSAGTLSPGEYGTLFQFLKVRSIALEMELATTIMEHADCACDICVSVPLAI